MFERFFRREFELDNTAQIHQALVHAIQQYAEKHRASGASPLLVSSPSEYVSRFEKYIHSNAGQQALDRVRMEADADGVFGAPSVVVEKELFFGNDRIDWVRKKLQKMKDPPADSASAHVRSSL